MDLLPALLLPVHLLQVGHLPAHHHLEDLLLVHLPQVLLLRGVHHLHLQVVLLHHLHLVVLLLQAAHLVVDHVTDLTVVVLNHPPGKTFFLLFHHVFVYMMILSQSVHHHLLLQVDLHQVLDANVVVVMLKEINGVKAIYCMNV